MGGGGGGGGARQIQGERKKRRRGRWRDTGSLVEDESGINVEREGK